MARLEAALQLLGGELKDGHLFHGQDCGVRLKPRTGRGGNQWGGRRFPVGPSAHDPRHAAPCARRGRLSRSRPCRQPCPPAQAGCASRGGQKQIGRPVPRWIEKGRRLIVVQAAKLHWAGYSGLGNPCRRGRGRIPSREYHGASRTVSDRRSVLHYILLPARARRAAWSDRRVERWTSGRERETGAGAPPITEAAQSDYYATKQNAP